MPPKPNTSVSGRFPSRDVFFGTSADLHRVVELDLAKVVPNPNQPRKSFDEEKLRELADSIQSKGLIHPITVKKTGEQSYIVVAGERRFRAFGILARTSIPAIISDGDADELALIENIQREDLSPIDEYEAVSRLIEKHGYNQEEAARVLGKSRVSINELMSLSGLSPAILEDARKTKVSKSTLIEIARAKTEEEQRALWAAAQGGATTVRAVRNVKKGRNKSAAESSPIGTAFRAGRRFAEAIDALPASDPRVAKIKSLAERLLTLLEKLNTKDQTP